LSRELRQVRGRKRRQRKSFAPYFQRRALSPPETTHLLVTVPAGYRCPFCPNHLDEDFFVWKGGLTEPICLGCTYDLFAIIEGWPNPAILRQSQEIATLERLSGGSMRQLQAVVATQEIADGEDLRRMRAVLQSKEEQQFGPPFVTRSLQARRDREAEEAARRKTDRRDHAVVRHKRLAILRQRRVTRVSDRFATRHQLLAEWRSRLDRFRALLAETQDAQVLG
jgi:hypothetical protein